MKCNPDHESKMKSSGMENRDLDSEVPVVKRNQTVRMENMGEWRKLYDKKKKVVEWRTWEYTEANLSE